MNQYIKQYEDFAKKYQKAQDSFYEKYHDKSREKFYSMIGDKVLGKRLIDVGCGTGKDMNHFQKLGSNVYGFDGSKRMVEISNELYPELTTVSVQEFESLNYDDDFFDLAISRYAIHYADDLNQTLKEVHRILKPNGEFTVLVAHPLLTFIAKKERIYRETAVVEIPLFDGAILIKEPSRTFSDYLNATTFSLFDLIGFLEGPGGENAPKENSFKEIVPDYAIFKLKKRTS